MLIVLVRSRRKIVSLLWTCTSLRSCPWNNTCMLMAVINHQRWAKQETFERISKALPAFQCFLEADRQNGSELLCCCLWLSWEFHKPDAFVDVFYMLQTFAVRELQPTPPQKNSKTKLHYFQGVRPIQQIQVRSTKSDGFCATFKSDDMVNTANRAIFLSFLPSEEKVETM